MKYKLRNDLNINDENIMESVFVEIITPKKKNMIVGVIYHQTASLIYLKNILSKIDKENKICI